MATLLKSYDLRHILSQPLWLCFLICKMVGVKVRVVGEE